MDGDAVIDEIIRWVEDAMNEGIEDFRIDDNFDSITIIPVEE